MPTKSIERHIEQLKKVGLIEFKGAAKTGGYHAIPKVRTVLNTFLLLRPDLDEYARCFFLALDSNYAQPYTTSAQDGFYRLVDACKQIKNFSVS